MDYTVSSPFGILQELQYKKGTTLLYKLCQLKMSAFEPLCSSQFTESLLTTTFFCHFSSGAATTYVQKCRQVLFNEYFIFDRVVCHFHITLCVTEFCVFWCLYR